MQDRTSANSMKVLLQRTAGPYIWVNHDRCGRSHATMYVRCCPKADKRADVSLSPLCAKTGLMHRSKLFARLVPAARKAGYDSTTLDLVEAISLDPKPYYERDRAFQMKGEFDTAIADVNEGNKNGYSRDTSRDKLL